MPKKIIELSGVYRDMDIVQMDNGKILDWSSLSDDRDVPFIPLVTKIKISLTYDDIVFLNGFNGIVWATYKY